MRRCCKYLLVALSPLVVLLAVYFAASPASALRGQERDDRNTKAHVFMHPEMLTSADKLSDGKSGKPIEIQGETTLLWIDLMPDARFAHDTEYVLISATGARVVKGSWWPVLNGKDLFRDGKTAQHETPITLIRK